MRAFISSKIHEARGKARGAYRYIYFGYFVFQIHYQNEIQMNKITDQMDKMLDLFNTDKTPNTNEKDLNASIDEILTLALNLSELLDNQIKSSSVYFLKSIFLNINSIFPFCKTNFSLGKSR